MQSRALGIDLPAVSAVGYGGMHLSIVDRPPEAESVRVIHAALDAGITLIDTANVYCLDETDIGHNERLIARALGSWGGARDRVVVATKGGSTRPLGRWVSDGRPDSLRRACEASLAALGVERIDLYQLHAVDPAVPLEDSVGALEALRASGKIGAVGLSNVSVDAIRRARAITTVSTVQNRLNPFFREALADGVVRYCAEQAIGFLAYSPTGGGRLTRKLPDHPVLRPMADALGVTPHALVLAWVRLQGPTVIPIPSARRAAHAEDSARSADLELSRADLAAIDGAVFDRS